MSIYFRNWKMAAAALIAVVHDMIITVGIYALIGFEVSPATMIGFLTVLGYSLYDTVVVFDKVRENTTEAFANGRMSYAEAANLAVNQTMVRSINTTIIGVLPVPPCSRSAPSGSGPACCSTSRSCSSSASSSAPTPRSSSPRPCSSRCGATSRPSSNWPSVPAGTRPGGPRTWPRPRPRGIRRG
jgi:hypothetical protein